MTRVLITGSSTGIGRATAMEMTARGYEVVATARRLETIADLDVKQKLVLDVDDDAPVLAAVAEAGPIDVLVNNAGYGLSGPVESVPLDEIKRMFETNVFGAIRVLQAVIPQMRERGAGTLVNVSSVSGRVTSPLGGFYSASKFALEAISEALFVEVAHFGVRTIVIEPGQIATEFHGKVRDHCDDGPYAALRVQTDQMRANLRGDGAPDAAFVARAIADAVDNPDAHGRIPVGPDAELICSTRASMDDDAFLATMRQVVGLTW